ncbi:hypothetical protein [Burkholderia ubonensis]|uniref:hypothetical protein n=1 Tax=Burkholderia ubonensis TaxID=101571 RepID=UPI00075BCF95|nr:hypothetical protein [Burkholderia ubonensis]KVV22004.1 hypothetical protein WK79_16765 [Burkholderia ubonensis]
MNAFRQFSTPRFVALWWLTLLACAVWMTASYWYASKVLGTATPLQYALIFLGFTVGLIADELCDRWRWHVACVLHIEDVVDGVCPDREDEITQAAVWRWYEHRGKPWWISSRRERPHVRTADAWQRFKAYDRAMKRQIRAARNHKV